MSYAALVTLILKLGLVADELDRREADLELQALGEAELDLLDALERAARMN